MKLLVIMMSFLFSAQAMAVCDRTAVTFGAQEGSMEQLLKLSYSCKPRAVKGEICVYKSKNKAFIKGTVDRTVLNSTKYYDYLIEKGSNWEKIWQKPAGNYPKSQHQDIALDVNFSTQYGVIVYIDHGPHLIFNDIKAVAEEIDCQWAE